MSAHIICLLILQNGYHAVAYFVLLMQSVTKQRKRIYRSHSSQKVDDCERLYFNPCWWEIFLLFSGIYSFIDIENIDNCTLWTFRSLGAKFHYDATILNMQRSVHKIVRAIPTWGSFCFSVLILSEASVLLAFSLHLTVSHKHHVKCVGASKGNGKNSA